MKCVDNVTMVPAGDHCVTFVPSRRLQSVLNVASLTNPYIDGLGTLRLPIYLKSQAMFGDNNDKFSITFQGTWLNIPSNVNINLKNFPSRTSLISGLIVTIFVDARIITAQLPAKTTVPLNTDCYLEINNFLNPAYLDTCGNGKDCSISYGSNIDGNTVEAFSVGASNGFWQDLRITAGQVTSFTFTSQGSKASAINLTFGLSFSTVPRVPAGSSLFVTLPSTYPQLSLRSPAASCSTTLAGATCTIVGTSARLTGFAALPANTIVSITIRKAKNPAKAGTYSGFVVSAVNAAGKTIINHTQSNTVTIAPGDLIAPYDFTLVGSTPTSGVTTSYVLSTSTSTVLYSGTTITLSLPLTFPLPTGLPSTM